ncbi:MAG: phosphate butyryltransferase [Lachnospiraceae bacterium]|nr:phosphate butyryltransferase [Lachnospiraceae bacterium]
MIKNFEQMEQLALSQPKQTVALAAADSEEALLAVEYARKKGLVDVHLVGNKENIQLLCQKNGMALSDYRLTDVADPAAAAAAAVALVREGEAQLLMKGLVETSDFLKAVLDREKGLRGPDRLCALVAIECASVNKLLILGDVGTNIAPDVKVKASILESSFTVARAMGIKNPKAAVLCANEHVKDSMPCTLEATELAGMSREGKISGIVEGPVSMDIAVNEHAALVKKYQGLIQGDADILLVPDLEAGNILIKGLMYLSSDIRVAGVGMGAKVPLIQTSRGDDHDTKYYSIVLSSLVSQYLQTK